jgi:hypothetical protein
MNYEQRTSDTEPAFCQAGSIFKFVILIVFMFTGWRLKMHCLHERNDPDNR